jgi:hypothetical protein
LWRTARFGFIWNVPPMPQTIALDRQ